MTATSTAPGTGAGETYLRKVSQIERGYLNAALQGSSPVIQTVVEGRGPIDPETLEAAVRAATEACPGLAVRRCGPVWRGGGPTPAVTVHPAAEDLDLDDDFFHRELDVVTGPVGEVGLFPGPTTRLVVRTSHIVTDGRGTQHWLADVFRVLRGEEPVGAPSVVDDTHFLSAAGQRPGDRRPAPGERPTAGDGIVLFPAVLTADGAPAPDPGPGAERALWVRRTLPGPAPAGTARIAAAVSRHLRGDSGRVIVPVDLRRHDRSVRSTANLSAQLLVDLRREDSWRRLHREILCALKGNHELRRLGRDFRRTNPFANTLAEAREHDDTRFPCTAIVSDHGAVDLGRFRTDGFAPTALYTLPMLVPYAEMFISSCQSPHGTELTLSCRRRPGALAAAQAVLDDVERLLTDPDGPASPALPPQPTTPKAQP